MSTSYRFPNSERCINCGWNMLKTLSKTSISYFNVRVGELPDAERELLTSWLPKIEGFECFPVCADCEDILSRLASEPRPVERRLGHRDNCAACGVTLGPRKRFYRMDPRFEELLRDFIQEHQVGEKRLCSSCYINTLHMSRKLEKRYEAEHSSSSVLVKKTENDPDHSLVTEIESCETRVLRNKTVIVEPVELNAITAVTSFPLEGYLNVQGKKGGVCVTCAEAGVRRMNLPTRQKLILRHKIYVSTSAKVCEQHREADNWPKNEDASQNNFTTEEIADVIFLLKGIWPVDFGKVENLHHHILNRWIGLTLEEFEELYQQKPVLQETPNGRFALAVWLASKHTGECATVLASLTQRPRGLITAAIKLANECTQPQ